MALIIELKVVAASGKRQLLLDKQGRLKCFVKAAAQDGKANYEVVGLIAETVGVSRVHVEIIRGLTNPKKHIAIHQNMTYQQFLVKAGLLIQSNIFSS